MLRKFLMPKLGQTMEEGTIGEWQKKEGDLIKKGDVVLEITTDKATIEVESFVEGYLLKTLVQPGEVVTVNTVIAILGDKGDKLPDDLGEFIGQQPDKPKAQADRTAPQPGAPVDTAAPAGPAAPSSPAHPGGRISASPRAKKTAKLEKVPLQLLTGSGPGGRITEADVKGYLERRKSVRATPSALEAAYEKAVDLLNVKPSGVDGRILLEDVKSATPAATSAPAAAQVQLTNMRRTIALRLAEAKQTIPHFYLFTEMDMTSAVQYRSNVNSDGGEKVSFNDLITSAVGNALQAVPTVNRQWHDNGLYQLSTFHVGVAVAVDDGLMVPVLRDVPGKDLRQIAVEAKALIEKARRKALLPDEYVGGSCTVSNIGVFAIDAVLPIINPPESFILGVGRIVPKPVVIDGGIHIRSMMQVTLAGDHRAIDGATGAQLLNAVRDLLENPERLKP